MGFINFYPYMLITDIRDRIDSILPLEKGQNDWDNIGVLVDTGSSSFNILLTIDITDEVIEECINKNIKHIVSYHPVIFSGIKRIEKNSLVIKLIKNGINVFSPHTSWDDEMNTYILSQLKGLTFEEIINKLKRETGLSKFRIVNKNVKYKDVIVGVGSAFRYHNHKDSLIITGEMTHHCLLHSIKNNNTVILLEHSNSERMTLKHMKAKIEPVLKECCIFISEKDKDPVELI